jgi:hypothetical protein
MCITYFIAFYLFTFVIDLPILILNPICSLTLEIIEVLRNDMVVTDV